MASSLPSNDESFKNPSLLKSSQGSHSSSDVISYSGTSREGSGGSSGYYSSSSQSHSSSGTSASPPLQSSESLSGQSVRSQPISGYLERSDSDTLPTLSLSGDVIASTPVESEGCAFSSYNSHATSTQNCNNNNTKDHGESGGGEEGEGNMNDSTSSSTSTAVMDTEEDDEVEEEGSGTVTSSGGSHGDEGDHGHSSNGGGEGGNEGKGSNEDQSWEGLGNGKDDSRGKGGNDGEGNSHTESRNNDNIRESVGETENLANTGDPQKSKLMEGNNNGSESSSQDFTVPLNDDMFTSVGPLLSQEIVSNEKEMEVEEEEEPAQSPVLIPSQDSDADNAPEMKDDDLTPLLPSPLPPALPVSEIHPPSSPSTVGSSQFRSSFAVQLSPSQSTQQLSNKQKMENIEEKMTKEDGNMDKEEKMKKEDGNMDRDVTPVQVSPHQTREPSQVISAVPPTNMSSFADSSLCVATAVATPIPLQTGAALLHNVPSPSSPQQSHQTSQLSGDYAT